MPWFRLDDNFHQHPKVVAAGNAAVGLWVRCATYSAQYSTEGHIPLRVARNLGRAREMQALIDSRLWVQNGDGFLIPDYLEYNPSAEQVEAARFAARQRQRRARESAHKKNVSR
jgi:hypothetical protein